MVSKDKIGCKVNGINIIDPNKYWSDTQSSAVLNDFFNASNNVPVPNEDLNISVQLETISKSRTILTNTGNSSSQNKVTVSFIDANLIDGKKSLTTNYTLLTTEFDKNKRNDVDENFGITDINIDFDTAYTPMITINFVDVRGSAIFQNDNELNNKNRYRVFFDFPYPIYKLTVKGYFGKPVTYCLHMTNFTSKFNSQTGNFEISAKFIGYTYAMLADMIMGYLRAIAYTKVGGDLYTAENVDNINDFIAKVDNINNSIQGITSTGPYATAKKKLETKLELINEIEKKIIDFGNTTENTTNSTLTSFNIIAIKNTNNDVNTYNSVVGSLKNSFNTAKPNNIALTQNYTATEIKNDIKNIISTTTQNILRTKFNINNNSNIEVSYYDFNNYIIEIDKVKTDIGLKINEQDKLIIQEIDKLLTSKNFDPTIKYVSNVFVTAIEVFLKTLYKVSYQLENDTARIDVLKTIFRKSENNDYGKTQQTKYYPWPAYYEEDNSSSKTNYVEKYLGEANGIKNNPTNYNKIGELKFVDELLNSIITSQQIANKQIIQNNNANLNWIPVNPADTRLFINDPPYLRIGNNINTELTPLILTRAITFLTYSNRTLTEPQIQEMAKAEAESIIELAATQNSNKIQALKLQLNDITNFLNEASGNVNIKDPVVNSYTNKKVLKQFSLSYEYDYIDFNNYGMNKTMVIPLKEGFSNNGGFTWELNPSQNNNIFLTNYNFSKINNINEKKDDGGLYVKIFNKATYENDIKPLKYNININNTINLSELESNNFDTLNPFGGQYGIQEFNSMDYGTLGTHDLMYVFYRDNEFNSLSEYRDINQISASTKYDIKQNKDIGVDQNLSFTNKTEVNVIYNKLNFTKNRDFLLKNNSTGLSYPFIELVNIYDSAIDKTGSFSLFGSAFYYSQPSTVLNNYCKALLFLSTLPFYNYDSDKNIIKLFPNEILNLFNQKASFIHAPRLWCALVGGILWRNDTSIYTINSSGQIIGGGSGIVDPINWSELSNIEGATLTNYSNLYNSRLRNIDEIIRYGFKKPERNEYLSILRLSLGVSEDIKNKPTNDFEILNNLPEQVKKEFKKIFFDFVNGTDDYEFKWEIIKNKLEIFDGNDINNFKTRIQNIISNGLTNNDNEIKYVNFITTNFKNIEYYQSFGLNNGDYDSLYPTDKQRAITETDGINGRRYFIKLELKGQYNDLINGEKSPVTLIIDGLKEKYIIANNSYRIWPESNPSTNTSVTDPHDKIIIDSDKLNTYFKQMYDVLNSAPLNQTNNALQASFGEDDLPQIKLKIYKYCKNIYDKWISGAETENVIYRCGESTQINKKLMDSFRFLSRSFQDIGDKFYLDTTEIPKNIRDNSNISFYNFYTNVLSDNNFDFIPLPTFINYNDEKEVRDVFKTYPDWYNKPIDERNNNCGPTFICVYGGEKSKALDLGDNSNYPNDGFNFDCDGVEIPGDFDTTSVQNGLAVFKVNYGQQNQNIFTDVQLDQSEFRETDESFKIQESLSNSKANIGLTSVGQNLYNIYNVRSYSSKITMLGNPMIQPMMYYQLNNIPMFKGAYLITNITHDIRPNHMTTTFTGQRIKYSTLPLIDKNLLTTKLSGINTNNNNIPTTTPPISLTTPSINLGFITPIKTYTSITSQQSFTSGNKHIGVDLAATTGTDLYSISDGEIETIAYDEDYGLYLIINHDKQGDGYYYKSLYAHLSDINPNIISNVDNTNLTPAIKSNIISKVWGPKTNVKKGDVIGKSGGDSKNITYLGDDNTYPLRGNASGAHLHFELKRSNMAFNGYFNVNGTEIVDPQTFISSLSSGVISNSNNGIIEIGKQTLPPISDPRYNI